ncbi:ribosomal protein S18-alanine N-acetyltransferase [Pyrobaculum aerophilum]|uniref:N-alpha-acetyltransferase n=2 Tax=Pyrobaculum aerophilum TaxID=13773 RepID=Q8ZYH6_PYRAE|nr:MULTISPECIES: ribosomal protein S18-alanine N-acetyltransferase [Pyrobaculum]AAL63017.1 N-acyltransferase [Pyrobaculum aerophilum str. IM2]MCX8136212.1 ribosomal protein S18-alanine N-acetyltransferase [Pyrobaculum aerophilum]RFA97436.1 ribosomal-protein-alanine N-acetyltransferase [Pyrobaculum aerophilum]RFA97499.1 ribosomal-protein-alanine N-acetyltransferase [Pyrobaculum aerophilum]HII48212.1 ribosomal protein S18-alanine N-acetyltransferase [Pyrobaculum aerophilum]
MTLEIRIDGPQRLLGKDGKTEFIIREATLKDLNDIISINRKVLPENYPNWFFVEHLEQFPKAFIVAEIEGKVVGYVMSRVEYGWSNIHRGKAVRKGHIVSVGVLPEARRLGIATAMMLRAMKAMKVYYGASEVYLEVRVSNTPAISLYEKLGYKVVGRIPRYYSDGEDAFLMACPL